MFPQLTNSHASHKSSSDTAYGQRARIAGFRPSVEALEERSPVALMVTPLGNNPMALVNILLGTGVQVSNISFNGTTDSAGSFTGGTGIIGFEAGIILSSGMASSVVGPNMSDSTTTDNGLPGDADLTNIVGAQTFDATVLEFDFIPASATITFNYVFGSEEYNEFVNSQFNDVFAFFVNGQNQALVPGTPTPVAINTVNGGNPFGTGASNPALYRNNDPNDPGPATIDTELDGLTVVLPLTATVNPNQVNHIKLAIADTSDPVLDSDVFIQAGSFSSPIPKPIVFDDFWPFRYIQDQQTGLLHGNLTLLNPSSVDAQFGPIQIIFPQLPAGVTLVNAAGTTDSGAPFLLIPDGTVVSPGEVFRIQLVFSDPTNTPISTFFIHPPVEFAVPPPPMGASAVASPLVHASASPLGVTHHSR